MKIILSYLNIIHVMLPIIISSNYSFIIYTVSIEYGAILYTGADPHSILSVAGLLTSAVAMLPVRVM